MNLQLAILGLGAAAAYSLLAMGLVLIHRASGVLNFSQGALAMAGAYFYYELAVLRGWAYWPAMITSILVTAFLGALIYLLLMRPLSRRAPLVRLIATVGVLVLLQSIAVMRYKSLVVTIPQKLPQDLVHVIVDFPVDRLWLIGIAATCTIVLYVVSKYTRFGLATRGVSENARTAASVGWSPDLVGTINWAIGAGLAALAGILIAPIASLSPSSLTFLIVPALACCLVGGFNSFPLTFLAAVILGVSQGIAGKWALDVPGIVDMLPLAMILVALLVRQQAIPGRGEIHHRLPALGRGLFNPWFVFTCLAGGVIGAILLPQEWVIAIGISVAVAIVILSVVVVTGYAGQLSLGQYALSGIGVLLAARAVAILDWPFAAAMALGIFGAAAAGLIFGAPSLRSRGAALAIVTLALGVAVKSAVFGNIKFGGGESGLVVKDLNFLGLHLDPLFAPRTYTIFALCWFAVAVWAVSNLRRSRAGRRLISIRANERAAASIGVNVGAAKLYAFSLSAGLAALGGILMAFTNPNVAVSAGPWDSVSSTVLVTQSVIGGVGFISGSVFGGQFAAGGFPGGVIVNHIGGDTAANWLALISGVLLLVTLLVNPDGFAGKAAEANKRFKARLSRLSPPALKRKPAAPVLVPQVGAEGSVPVVRVSIQSNERQESTMMRVTGLSVDFGGVRALKNVDLELRSGEILGLIGPNGSGKTTLVDAVTGFVRSRGAVEIGARRVDGLAPHRRVRAGITRSFQSLELFDDITVEENLRAAADSQDAMAYVNAILPVRAKPAPDVVRMVIETFQLAPVLDRHPRELSHGQRRLVAIARAVGTAPKFLLLDEPAAGLSSTETAELSAVITGVAREWNIGVLLIEHDMSMVLGVCDRIAVLDFGDKIAEGTPDDVRANAAVIDAYLGKPHESAETPESLVTSANPSARS